MAFYLQIFSIILWWIKVQLNWILFVVFLHKRMWHLPFGTIFLISIPLLKIKVLKFLVTTCGRSGRNKIKRSISIQRIPLPLQEKDFFFYLFLHSSTHFRPPDKQVQSQNIQKIIILFSNYLPVIQLNVSFHVPTLSSMLQFSHKSDVNF